MITRLLAAALIASIPCAEVARADDAAAADPDWPCAQALVPKISAAQLWTRDLPENSAMTAPPELSDLGRSAMDPRIADDKAVKLLKDYFAKVKDRKKVESQAPTVFVVALTEANSQRQQQINGIKSFTRGQFELSRKLAEDVNELDKKTAGQPAKEGTPEKAIEDRVQMERRIFEDREHQVKYLCETPAGGEGRIGIVARTLDGFLGKK